MDKIDIFLYHDVAPSYNETRVTTILFSGLGSLVVENVVIRVSNSSDCPEAIHSKAALLQVCHSEMGDTAGFCNLKTRFSPLGIRFSS